MISKQRTVWTDFNLFCGTNDIHDDLMLSTQLILHFLSLIEGLSIDQHLLLILQLTGVRWGCQSLTFFLLSNKSNIVIDRKLLNLHALFAVLAINNLIFFLQDVL